MTHAADKVHDMPGVPEVPSTFRRFSLVLLLACMVVVVDQVSKALVRSTLGSGRVIRLLGGLVQLDFTRNTGAAFGILRSSGILFVLVAIVVSAGILLLHRRVAASPSLVRVSLGLILGGALGNLIDRLRYGYVTDFIDLRWWPVFNLADSAIVIGVFVLTVFGALREERRVT
jgi:signal peptidase II